MSDHETNFEKWITACNEHERRKSFCHFMRDKYPPDHQFVKEAKANWTKRGPNTNGFRRTVMRGATLCRGPIKGTGRPLRWPSQLRH